MKNSWRSRSMSSTGLSDTASRTDTISQTTRSSTADFSTVSTTSANTTTSSHSSRRQQKRVSDVILCCFGSASDDDHTNLPSPTSTNLEMKKFINKKRSFEVISGDVRFTWDEILRATRSFSSDLIIGKGGTGVVYRGKLDNGKDVAIKRARKDVDDEHLTNESFRTEIETLQQVSHMNLVGFYGYLLFEDEKIVVVEYIPNGNLRQHLDCQNGEVLEFANRLDIMIDVSHSITYLHTYCEKPLIHRDIKSSNILLTDTLRGKVADFGLAKLASTDANNTIVQTVAKGTPGYIDPEYFNTNQLTSKSDVYSFGVVLVETVTGKRPMERTNNTLAVKWAMKEFLNKNAISTLDPNLKPDAAIAVAVVQIYELAFQCLNAERRKRPTMDECGRTLWNIRKTYSDLGRKDH